MREIALALPPVEDRFLTGSTTRTRGFPAGERGFPAGERGLPAGVVLSLEELRRRLGAPGGRWRGLLGNLGRWGKAQAAAQGGGGLTSPRGWVSGSLA